MSRPLHRVGLFMLVPLMSRGVFAQPEPVLSRGSHIEIVSERLPGGISVGWLETLTKDTLSFVDSTGTTEVALTDIGQLRVNVGRDESSLNIATLFGAILGAAISPLLRPESFECRHGLAGDDECGDEVPKEVVGALFGAGAFRVLAKFTTKERWANVRLDRLLYSVGPKISSRGR